jgi:hypothetical protein
VLILPGDLGLEVVLPVLAGQLVLGGDGLIGGREGGREGGEGGGLDVVLSLLLRGVHKRNGRRKRGEEGRKTKKGGK